MTGLFLIGCSKVKAPFACAAQDLYQGDLFKRARAYAESRDGRWFILSARHGLLRPADVIEPYDVRMHDLNAGQQFRWGARVKMQLHEIRADQSPVTILAGRAYIDALNLPPEQVLAPLKGLGLGHQKQWLEANRLRQAVPA